MSQDALTASLGSNYPEGMVTPPESSISSHDYAFTASASIIKQAKIIYPSIDLLSSPVNLCNWLPNFGATWHMTPCLANLDDMEEGFDLGVEVADGHII